MPFTLDDLASSVYADMYAGGAPTTFFILWFCKGVRKPQKHAKLATAPQPTITPQGTTLFNIYIYFPVIFMYILIYIYIFICTYSYVYTHIFICIYMHVYMCVYISWAQKIILSSTFVQFLVT